MTETNTAHQPNQELNDPDLTVIYILALLVLMPFLFPLLIPLAILYLPTQENNA